MHATNLKLRNDYPGIQLHGWKVGLLRCSPLPTSSASRDTALCLTLTGMLCLQLWPLASLVNYRFVPVKLRVLFVNCVAFLWYVLLCCVLCKCAAHPAGEQVCMC